MLEFNIRCIIKDSIDNAKYKLLIFSNDKLICKKDINNTFKINLKNGLYKVIIIAKDNIFPKYIEKHVYINTKWCNTLKIYFNKNNYYKPIRFYLTDMNYKNLKIMKGRLNLWQNHIL